MWHDLFNKSLSHIFISCYTFLLIILFFSTFVLLCVIEVRPMDSKMLCSATSSKMHMPLLQPPAFVVPILHLIYLVKCLPLVLQFHFQCHDHFHFCSRIPM